MNPDVKRSRRLLVPSSLVRAQEESTTREAIPELRKSKDAWRGLLRAFTSPLNDEKRKGTYICAACLLPLFESDTKFDSGTGWPSFIQPIPGRTGTKRDFKLIFLRTEYHCIRCTGHQGHIFNDGPRPTGERWCNNGVALKFVPEGEELPALRH